MASMLKRLSLGGGGGGKANSEAQVAFKDSISAEQLDFFNEVAKKPFSEQAIAFLNAYWSEIGDQAPFIFDVLWDTIKYCDMHTKGVSLIHLYEEGTELEFTAGLYFYEQTCKRVLDDPTGAKWRNDPAYKVSMPEMMTAIVRKKELRDKVDVNFDGKISLLEVLLYQYRHLTNPAEFTRRGLIARKGGDNSSPKILAARQALDEVNAKIRAYEEEKSRLTEASKLPGVKGLGAKHQLTMLVSSPVAEDLAVALIKAEAAVRMATREARKANGDGGEDGDQSSAPNQGSLFWLNADLQMKKKLYGRKAGK